LFGKEKKPLRWLVFLTKNLFFGKPQKLSCLVCLLLMCRFSFAMKVAGKNCHTANEKQYAALPFFVGFNGKMFDYR
jgi:hypothetical protein